MATLLARVWKAIGSAGANPAHPPRLAKQIRYSNFVGVAFALISTPTMIIVSSRALVLGLVLTAACLLYTSPPFLNFRGWHRLARSIPLLAGNFIIFVVGTAVGLHTNAQLCLFVLAVLPFVVFDIREAKTLVLLGLLPPLSYFLLLSGQRFGIPVFSLDGRTSLVLSYTVVASAFTGLSLLLGIFYFDNQRNEDALYATIADLRTQMEERRRVQEELVRAKEAAESGTQAKSEFLATMSHEIRTPLNGVIGMSSLLAETRLDDSQREMLRTVLSSGEFLLTLINDILDFSKIEAGKLSLERTELDPAALVEETLAPLAHEARRRGLDLFFSCAPEVPARVMGDPARLRQVLTNLVGNALKFTPAGHVWVRIGARAGEGGGVRLRIEVEDTGIGVPAAARATIFEAFTQSDSSTTRRYGGTGLGLAICRRLVERMGGEIDCQSVEGAGSTFWFSVPLDVAVVAAPAQPFAGRRLLVATASVPLGRALTSACSSLGAAVTTGQVAPAPPDGAGSFDAALVEVTEAVPSAALAVAASWGLSPARTLLVQPLGRALAGVEALPRHLPRTRLAEALAAVFTASAASAAPLFVEPRASPFGGSHGRVARILLAEDNPTNQRIVMAIIASMGFDCLLAEDGEQAVALFREEKVDLVLLDLQMPRLDGIGAARVIRSLEAGARHVPIVALTANTTPEARADALAAGMDTFLVKPSPPRKLREVIRGLLPPELVCDLPPAGEPSQSYRRPSSSIDVPLPRVQTPMKLT